MSNRLTGWMVCIVVLAAGREIAAADIESGKAVSLLCQACHSMKPGEKNIGPTLYGVLGRRAGSVPDFEYSPAMKSAGTLWSRKNLDTFLKNPATFIPGTKMALAGVPDALDRADLIAYLSQLGKSASVHK
jgi:cytochrome c